MKRFTIVFILFNVLLFSCSTEDDISTSNIEIKGIVKGAQNQFIYLEAPSENGIIEVAKVKLSGTGSFTIKGDIPGFSIYNLRLGEGNSNIILLPIAPNDKLALNTTVKSFNDKPLISGISWSAQANEYYDFIDIQKKRSLKFKNSDQNSSNNDFQNYLINARNKIDSFSVSSLKKHPKSTFNIVLFPALFPLSSIEKWDKNNLLLMRQVIRNLQGKYSKSSLVNRYSNQVDKIETAYLEYVGMKNGKIDAPDFALQTVDGEKLKLSDLQGKYVLIDFWASWCGPCRRENPNLVKLYKKFRNKEFTILSVSLDNNADAWKKAINKDGLLWSNHVSDLLGWESPLTKIYKFNEIPYTVLVNKEGKIIAKNLRGKQLENKLSEILK
tara:strand:- start:584 stop:1735 length:1152 start_codon:yes stop_codon:yes gene_type:complete